jgi:hypothetical protein
MAASLTTHSRWNLAAYQEEVISLVSDDSGDWIVLTAPGIVAPSLTGDTGAALACTYGTLNTHNKGTAYTATTTSIVYNEASPGSTTRLPGAYYIMHATTGEIMWVVNDSGYTADTGTLTVVRGCLGTTAGLCADDAVLNVLNVIVTGADIDGRAFVRGVILPSNYKAPMFKE